MDEPRHPETTEPYTERTRGPRCLYVIYWGLTEPIGQSGPLPTLVALADAGEQLHILSFDKPADRRVPGVLERTRSSLARARIRWIDLGYTKRPANVSTGWDIFKGVVVGGLQIARHRLEVVHGRTFVGSFVGAVLRAVLPGIGFVCHPDGFWPDERVDDGFWLEGSVAHRLSLAMERFAYRRADAIIVLSEKARERLREDPALQQTPIHVVPTSVDLARFSLARPRPLHEPMRLVHLGSLGRRYLAKETFRFFATAKRVDGGSGITVATRVSEDVIEAALEKSGLGREDFSLLRLDPADVPAVLADQHVGVFFLRDGRSNLATSATKVGEYLAAGLAVVLTANCGDLHELVERTRTGVVIRDHSTRAYEAALLELRVLTSDPELPARCRAVAATNMGLDVVVRAQAAIHRAVAEQANRRTA